MLFIGAVIKNDSPFLEYMSSIKLFKLAGLNPSHRPSPTAYKSEAKSLIHQATTTCSLVHQISQLYRVYSRHKVQGQVNEKLFSRYLEAQSIPWRCHTAILMYTAHNTSSQCQGNVRTK